MSRPELSVRSIERSVRDDGWIDVDSSDTPNHLLCYLHSFCLFSVHRSNENAVYPLT